MLTQVTDVWISTPPSHYAFVTFSSADGVEQALADLPIVIFGLRYELISLETFVRQLSQVTRGSKET